MEAARSEGGTTEEVRALVRAALRTSGGIPETVWRGLGRGEVRGVELRRVGEGGGLVGAAVWSLAPSESGEEAYVVAFAVAAVWRGQGWGKRLWSELEREAAAAGAKRIRLHALAADEDVVGFYASRGLRVVERCPRYYARLGAESDAVVMVRDLASSSASSSSSSVSS